MTFTVNECFESNGVKSWKFEKQIYMTWSRLVDEMKFPGDSWGSKNALLTESFKETNIA